MLNVTIHLGSATPFSCRAGPRAPVHRAHLSAPALLSLPPGPARQRPASLCPNSDTPPARAASVSRPAGTRSGRHPPVRARPQERPRAAWHPHGRTPLLSAPFPLSAAPPTEPFERDRTSHPLSRHQLLSGPPLKHRLPPHYFCAHTAASGHRRPLPRVGFCRAPPLPSPSLVSALRASPFPNWS
jgi:hypothetical protein